MPAIKLIPRDTEIEKKNALEMIEELRSNIESGKTVRFGLVQFGPSGFWTEFSSATDRLRDGAVLIQLGMRLLGLAGDAD